MSNPWAEFDAWVVERKIPADRLPEAFAEWLADKIDGAVIAGPVGEPPEIVALPEATDE
jgi:hypothetical protein